MKGLGMLQIESQGVGLFVPFLQSRTILESRHQKENSACDELKLDKM